MSNINDSVLNKLTVISIKKSSRLFLEFSITKTFIAQSKGLISELDLPLDIYLLTKALKCQQHSALCFHAPVHFSGPQCNIG